MKQNKISRMIASVLVLALTVGLVPAFAAEEDDTQEVFEPVNESVLPVSDPMLGVQSGVEDIPTDVPDHPRSREELMALDSVVLSEDGEPVAVLGSKDNITFEEMKILFSPVANYALRSESNPNQELREKFGLTDADIELGSSLHGSRLNYTTELGNLAVKAEYMNVSETQMAELVDLISSGYSCYHAMRALAAKDLLGFTLDELKTARQQEIQAEEQEEAEEITLEEQEETNEDETPPDIVGLPTVLAEKAVELIGKDAQGIEEDITAAMRQTYAAPADNEEGALMAAAAYSQVTYAPEEVLGQPYRYEQQGDFNVNLNTGSYSYSETDLSIPGKNGLDLVLTRQYHSDRANTIENESLIYATRSITSRDMFKVHYRWYEVDTHGDLLQELVNKGNYHADDPYNEALINDEEIYTFDDYESAVHQKARMLALGVVTMQVFDRDEKAYLIQLLPTIDIIDEATFGKYIYSVGNDEDFYVNEFGLGHGWMLGLSHLRWISYGGGDLDTAINRRIQLVLSDGTQYMIDKDFWGNGIENYDGDDLKFCECTSSEYPNAAYALRYKDGRVEYFNSYGQNIAIRDRLDNTITIAYTRATANSEKVTKIQITDTVGNLVVYEEVPLDDTQWYTVKTPAGSKRYNKMWKLSLNGAVVRKYYSYEQDWKVSTDGTTHPVTLLAVENEAGEVTGYSNACTPVFYNCFMQPTERESLNTGKKLHATDGYDLLVTMYQVSYPNYGSETVSHTQKPVKTFSGNGYRHYIRCDRLTPMNSESTSNPANTQYTYGDFDQLELCHYGDQRYATTVKSQHMYATYEAANGAMPWTDSELTYTFNTSAQNTKVEKWSYSEMPLRQDGIPEGEMKNLLRNQTSWVAQITEYTYENTWSLWPKTIKTTYKDQTSEKQMTREEEYTYDTKGNVLTYKKPNGETDTYTYNEAYSIPLTITSKQDVNTTLVTTNTLSADGKSIASTEVKSNDATVSKSVYRYDSYGQLLAQDDYKDAENCVTTSYSYNYATSALPIQVSVAGVKTAGNVDAASSPSFPAGTVGRKQTYNKRGWVTSETDANGNTTNYTYDAVGRITGVTHPNGDTLGYSYSVVGKTVTYTDEAGNQWKCLYGDSGKLLRVTDLTTNQKLQENTYDRKDRLVKQVVYGNTTPNQTTYYRYDTDGRLVELERVDENGAVIYDESYKYEDGAGKVTKTVSGDSNAPSMVTTSYQDNMGNVVKTGVFRNNVEEPNIYAYDFMGNQTQVQTAFSQSKGCITTSSTYDHAGRVLSTVDADGNTTTYTYDWLGNQLSVTSPKNQPDSRKVTYPITYQYDALNRLIQVKTPLAAGHNGQTDYTYDPNGNVTQERTLTGAKGNTSNARNTYYTYDNMNRLTQAKGNAKQEGQTGADQYQYTNYTYDVLGNIKTMSVGNGTSQKTTQYTYDRYSRLTQYKDALGRAETYAYDLNGLLTSKTDRRGITTTNTYDAMGRLTRSAAGQDSLAFTYTKTGQRRTASSNGTISTYTYDSMGNLLKEVTPVATKTMTYGIGGVRNSFTVSANGKSYLNNQYDYNKLGYLTKVNSGNVEAHYSYDSNGNVNNVTNGNRTTANYTYNKADMVTEIKNKSNGAELSNFKYTYAADGNQLTKTDKRNGQSVQTNYTYDGLNRLTGESKANVVGATSAYTYDAYGNRQSMTTGAGTTTNYTYDAANRLLSTSGSNAATYTYDNQGNMTQMVLTVGDTSRTVNCAYDGFNRLQKFSDNSGETVYTYDADGLWASKTTSGGSEYYVYDNGQLVVTIVPPANLLLSTTASPDGSSDATFALTAEQFYYVEVDGVVYPARAEEGYHTTTYALPMGGEDKPETPVDPPDPDEPPVSLGEYVSLVAGDVAIIYALDTKTTTMYGPGGAVVKVYANDPTMTGATYVRGLNLIASVKDGKATYYHYNAHGDVVQLTDSTGALVKDYTYDAFGVEQNADDTDTNPFRYCGEQFDAETGDYYLRARNYTPGTGRFTQEDPIRDGLNWYAYCAGNPVGFVDSSGLAAYIIFGDDQAYAAPDYCLEILSYDETQTIYSMTVKTPDDFYKAWNGMGTIYGKGESIDYVVINLHGDPETLYATKDKKDAIDLSLLDRKDIGCLLLLACNTGHMDYIDRSNYFSKNNNVGIQFAVNQNVKSVIAPDGTHVRRRRWLGFLPGITNHVIGDETFQDGWKNGERKSRGFILYQYWETNNTTSFTTMPTGYSSVSSIKTLIELAVEHGRH